MQSANMFTDWLVDKGCLEEFISNLKDDGEYKDINALFDGQGKYKHTCDPVSEGFIWDDTSEGHKYWQRLSEEFAKYKETYKEPVVTKLTTFKVKDYK